mmetsp:Transcript_32381/g.72585  ORF Transcript_32381/g.72585 Transcript_32381/m.72585 type:complete len:265 (+) Transcript_32381:38-832(+)
MAAEMERSVLPGVPRKLDLVRQETIWRQMCSKEKKFAALATTEHPSAFLFGPTAQFWQNQSAYPSAKDVTQTAVKVPSPAPSVVSDAGGPGELEHRVLQRAVIDKPLDKAKRPQSAPRTRQPDRDMLEQHRDRQSHSRERRHSRDRHEDRRTRHRRPRSAPRSMSVPHFGRDTERPPTADRYKYFSTRGMRERGGKDLNEGIHERTITPTRRPPSPQGSTWSTRARQLDCTPDFVLVDGVRRPRQGPPRRCHTCKSLTRSGKFV